MLKQKISPSFRRDVKRLQRKCVDTKPLKEVMLLVLEDTRDAKKVLKQRHKMHALKGEWKDSLECHVANVGDWLLIWCVADGFAVFQRTNWHS